MRRSRIALALLALAAGTSGAWAAKLDKSACNVLNAELGGIVAAGAREDMERGPEWAKVHLTRESLGRIHRLIELEEQLEFRCGMQRSRVVSIEAEPPTGRDGKVVVPEGPEKKPAIKTNATKPPQDAKRPAPEKAAAGSPQKPVSIPPAGTSPVETAATQPQPQPSSSKSSRRRSSAAYVSPTEVNPFFVTRYGDTQ